MSELTESITSGPSEVSARELGGSELVRGLGVWSATAFCGWGGDRTRHISRRQ